MKLPQKYKELVPAQRRLVREEYIRVQEGDCYFCKTPLNGDPADHVMIKKINWKLFPKGFLQNPVHLHHSHVTGLTIGAVHARCNAVLWQYYDE